MYASSLPRAEGSANVSLLSKVGLLFSFDMIAAAVGSYNGSSITSGLAFWGLVIASFGMLIITQVFNSANNKSMAIFCAVIFAYLVGCWCGPCIAAFGHGLGWSTVAFAFLGTTLAMVVFGGIGAFSGRDFTSWGPFLFQALIGLIVARLIFLFLPGMSSTSIVSGLLGIVVFSGYFVYDFFKASHGENTWNNAIDHSLSIFLDFVNFFLSLLELFSGSK